MTSGRPQPDAPDKAAAPANNTAPANKAAPKRRGLSIVLIVLGALLLGLPVILRLFFYEPFKVPAGSMIPTLLIGDHFFLQRTDTGAALGDVIVFAYPDNRSQQFVKRVVAREGDTIESYSGRLVLNDKPIALCEVGAVALGDMRGHLYLEALTGRGHLILLDAPLTSCKQDSDCGSGARCQAGYCGHSSGPHSVPAGEVWVAGDNRNNSYDSFQWNGGAGQGVPLDDVRGRVGVLWWEGRSSGRVGNQVNGPPFLPAAAPAALRDALARCLNGGGAVSGS